MALMYSLRSGIEDGTVDVEELEKIIQPDINRFKKLLKMWKEHDKQKE